MIIIQWSLLYISSGQPSDVLQEASVPIISDAICNAPDYYDNQITISMFCAGYEKGGTDACQVLQNITAMTSPWKFSLYNFQDWKCVLP